MTSGSLLAERSVLKTAPTVEPVTLAEAKAHLRVAHSADDDYIETLITVARQHVENTTGLALLQQTWYLYADGWPAGDRFRLPRAPLSSVTSLAYKDTDGDSTTWAAANYIVDTKPRPGELIRAYGVSWPSAVLYPSSPITIEYVAGYGTTAATVPEAIRQAVLLLVAHWYEMREPVVTGTIVARLPLAVEHLLAPYQVEWF